ncbi:MAG: amidohydrolase [Oscillospiraceae bacterium]|nr:amidohydrolase [Oscillospiraceae bacterium]
MRYEKYLNVIDEKHDIFYNISDSLWENPEIPFHEYEAAKLITAELEKEGFTVTRGVAGMPTAFTATYGSGSPKLGILAEYDALSGMSQVGCITEKKSIPGIDAGHGCGHNLFAGGSVAAAFAVKAYIEATGKGSITLFGCPAEEGGGGKVFMARDGIFDGIESVVSWHPEAMNMVRTRPALANVKVDYAFEGIAAHAGAAPHRGRSALDAVELMNVGCNFLREHMELTSRVHYAILDAGGTAPNQVQSHAVVRYMIRAVDSEGVRDLHARIDRIAQGAALMTDTTVTSRVTSAYSSLVTIPTLQATANETLHDVPVPQATEEELAFAKELQKTFKVPKEKEHLPPYANNVLDPAPPVAHGGSTDTADVSWVTPTVQLHIGTSVVGTPGHSWQSVANNRGSFAKKSMLFAGKIVAGTLMRLIDDPTLVEKAKAEHLEKTGGQYICPIPADLLPDTPENLGKHGM